MKMVPDFRNIENNGTESHIMFNETLSDVNALYLSAEKLNLIILKRTCLTEICFFTTRENILEISLDA